MFKRIVALVIVLALVISFVPNTQEAFAEEKKKVPSSIDYVSFLIDSETRTVSPTWSKSKNAKKYEVRVKVPDKFWHKYKVVKKTKKNKKKYTVKGKYKVKKKGKKKYQVYKYGVAYRSYYTKNRWMDLKMKEGKKYYIKIRGINGKLKGKFTKTENYIPEYWVDGEDDANAGFDGDYYIDGDY